MEASTFTCSICGEASREICIFCTKDACGNHLCERCARCSDCCECATRIKEQHWNGDIHSMGATPPIPFNATAPE